eukprot:scaffold90447_cov46-Attheya_sp.AAC.2
MGFFCFMHGVKSVIVLESLRCGAAVQKGVISPISRFRWIECKEGVSHSIRICLRLIGTTRLGFHS